MSLFSFLNRKKSDPVASGNGSYSRAEPGSGTSRGAADRKAARGDPVDPALPEKKRARRRLVGAVALVLALVIGLPMILDSEPKPMTGDIAIQIPSKNSNPPALTEPPKDAVGTNASVAPSTADKLAGLDAREQIVEPTTGSKSPAPSSTSSSTPITGSVAPAPSVTPAPVATKEKPSVTAPVEAPSKPVSSEH
ncbi:MAG: hypothetical protein ABI351_09325, partial [Herbaspirillum sp.]